MSFFYQLLHFVPKAYLSWLVGKIAATRLPRFLRVPVLTVFSRAYGIQVEEAEFPLAAYSSVSAFFVRRLKPDLRPVQSTFVSPVDGTLRRLERVQQGSVLQVKGVRFSLEKLLQNAERAKSYENCFVANLYLSPRDYHHVHSPCSGKLVSTTHIPGKLWPVNDWSLHAIDGLFVTNERVVLEIESEFGLCSLVMVGATNVGKMSFPHMSLCTNQSPWLKQQISRIEHAKPILLEAGQLLGTFHLGSSVVLCCPAGLELSYPELSSIRLGQSLLAR